MVWIFYIIIGIVAGVISGLLGIGGATIVIPALVFLAGFDQKLAQGTTLFLMLFPIGLLAAVEYYNAGYVKIKEGIVIAIFFLLGGWLGSKVALRLDAAILRKVFSIFLFFVALRMFFK
ncbi:MAG: sulfite exporter TauE/SafE family protein [Brevinematales bacterium]|nr:sulfite exporter TauE/SafE family protein [Brevinematales bacterium]